MPYVKDFIKDTDHYMDTMRWTTRQQPERAGMIWEDWEDDLIKDNSQCLDTLAEEVQRTPNAVVLRAERLVNQGELDPAIYMDYKIDLEDSTNPPHFGKKDKEMKDGNNTWAMVSLLQENITTIGVRLNGSYKSYTYKTRISDIEEGDFVVVLGAKELTIGEVIKVDDVPNIDPNADFKYKWVVQKVDTGIFDQLTEKDEEAYKLLIEAEKKVAKDKLVNLYKETLGLENQSDLKKLLGNF